MMPRDSQCVRTFLREETGSIGGATSYMASTMAIALPLGIILFGIYEALCDAGRYTNFVLGLF